MLKTISQYNVGILWNSKNVITLLYLYFIQWCHLKTGVILNSKILAGFKYYLNCISYNTNIIRVVEREDEAFSFAIFGQYLGTGKLIINLFLLKNLNNLNYDYVTVKKSFTRSATIRVMISAQVMNSFQFCTFSVLYRLFQERALLKIYLRWCNVFLFLWLLLRFYCISYCVSQSQ